ncbi:MAG TPA: hypothetical protein VF188_03905 [Longimicrobiales bacterium]
MNKLDKSRTRGALLALGCALLLAPACDAVDDLLTVNNPARIFPEELNDAQLIDVLSNSVVGELQDMYDGYIVWRGSMLTDEQVSGINWEETARLSQRIVRYNEGYANEMFGSLSQLRMVSDTVAKLLRGLVEDPSSSEELAQTLAYGGYSNVLMGDMMCEATYDMGAEILQPVQIYQGAIPKFEEAIQIATAAGREDIANFARVGLARAYLNIGTPEADAQAMALAAQVPEDFAWWAYYRLNSGENDLYGQTHGNNHTLGVHPHFLNGGPQAFGDHDIVAAQTDPRIQHTPDWSTGHNDLTPLYTPYQGLRFSGYNGETIATGGEPAEFERDTDIQIASGLEALHIYYEAAGPDATDGPAGSTLDFVNARRAFGNQPPVNLSGAELMAELREQRGRDMYLSGLRLGDLRRWLRQDGIDLFPSGPHVNEIWGDYGDATCFPLPLDEYEGNDNLQDPHQ